MDRDASAATRPSTSGWTGAPPLGSRLRGARWAMRARLSERDAYLALARARHGAAVATDETELVIDGYPRCGNTFAVVAFQLAQPQPRRVSHHIHSAANLVWAVRRGLPVVVTIRRPVEAVVSCVIREPYVSLRQALAAYTGLYERLVPHRDRVLVADFRQITTDMGAVIDRTNSRFGTAFARFTHVPENVQQCFAIIEDRARRPPWSDAIGRFLSGTGTLAELRAAAAGAPADLSPIPEHRVGRPSVARAQQRVELERAYAAPELASARAEAERVYALVAPGD